jgi:hypothetical protein
MELEMQTVVVTEANGRQLIGRTKQVHDSFMTLHDPIIYIEQPGPQGQFKSGFAPVMFGHLVDTIHVAVSTLVVLAPDCKLALQYATNYEQMSLSMRAAQAGITMATTTAPPQRTNGPVLVK